MPVGNRGAVAEPPPELPAKGRGVAEGRSLLDLGADPPPLIGIGALTWSLLDFGADPDPANCLGGATLSLLDLGADPDPANGLGGATLSLLDFGADPPPLTVIGALLPVGNRLTRSLLDLVLLPVAGPPIS